MKHNDVLQKAISDEYLRLTFQFLF